MNPNRLPIHAKALPEIDWRRSGDKLFLDPAADDLASYQVYRYCSLPEALQLLGRGEWSFAHPRTWPDRYEHHVSQQLFAGDGPFAQVAAHVKCMSVEFASNALWRTYAGPVGVLRIGIALQDLVAMLAAANLPASARLYIARSRYLDEPQLRRAVKRLRDAPPKPGAGEAMRALTLKRAGFAYENELRLCLLTSTRSEPASFRILTGLRREKVKSVQIDPYLPAWQAEELCGLLVNGIGLDPRRVRQSRFDASARP